MTIPDLGKLNEVDLRDAWPHEAHSFTPWLAEHLDELSAALGIPLELEGQEVAVESFSADVLARNPQDGSLVLIENQLEETDHTHLGQIMTYLAGLEAHIVVWIAKDFNDAHLSAVRWLNDHVVEPYAFFAVKVRAVRIGDSPIAPVFEVLEKPSQWERELRQVSETTPLGRFRGRFWTYYLQRHPDHLRHGRADLTSNRWCEVQDWDVVVSYFLSKQGVGLFYRGQRGATHEEIYETLQPHAIDLEQATGAKMGAGGGGHHFFQNLQVDATDEARWDELADWLHGKTEQYVNALQEAGKQDGS